MTAFLTILYGVPTTSIRSDTFPTQSSSSSWHDHVLVGRGGSIVCVQKTNAIQESRELRVEDSRWRACVQEKQEKGEQK